MRKVTCGRLFLITFVIAALSSLSQAAPPQFHLEKIATGLERPLFVTHDNTPRLFIVEQPGRIRVMRDRQLLETPYLDIVNQVESHGECGLLSVAFHPNFAKNGLLYVDYTTKHPNLHTVISEFRADPKSDTVDPKTERILLTIDQPYPNHNGGQIVFGPDKMLYIGMGDGGAGGDPGNRAQNPKELLGKILRIDVNQRTPYGIPKDNPFVKDPNFRPEIWALGMRNPWRFSFDRKTGIGYIGDVGQNIWEEIDILKRGGNYGWRLREGFHDFKSDGTIHAGLIDPIKEYNHTVGLSVTGGYVYRGKAIPDLVGWYVYADYAKGQLWGVKYDGKQITDETQFMTMKGQPAGFGEDVAGELYVCDHGHGTVLKIVPGESPKPEARNPNQ